MSCGHIIESGAAMRILNVPLTPEAKQLLMNE